MPNILDLSARLSADVRPFVNSMGSSAQASSSTFQSIAQAATMYLGGRGLLGTLNRANEAFMSFEQSLADASAISTLSVKEIGNALLDLDNVFGRVSKASASMYRILSSGFSKLDATQLVEFQKAVGVSAKVIRADLYNTADVMTTIANAYQLNIDEIKKLQDWFYITVREGKAQGQDLARTLGLVINSASEAGVSLNELGAAIAVLSRTQSVSQSMIGLNQMLNAFIKPTLQAQAAARKWGIELNATALQTRGLTSFLTELHEKVGGNVEALEAMFGNIRAGRAILSLTGKQFQNYLNVLNTYNTEEGGGAEAFAKQIDTLQNAYERFQAQQEKTLIQIGEDWEGVRKVVYRTGESMLKAFSDTSAFSRWTIYFAGIGLAVKNIISVVRNLKNSIDGTTRSVDRLASAFTRAALSSHGMDSGMYLGARPDTIALRKKIDTAVRTVTGSQTPLQAKYDAFIRQANPWGFKSATGINPKYNPYAFIAQNTLSPLVADHRAIAAQMAEEAMSNYFIKYKDKVDPNTGAVVDWYVKNAKTGFVYKRTWNQLKANMTDNIFIQNEKAMNAVRTDIVEAIRVLGGAKGTEAQILQDATNRVNAFYSGRRGYRYGTISGMTSGERLMRMKNISPLSFRGQFGIGLSNFGKGWNTFTTTLGENMGKVFTAVATVSMVSAVAEWGYRFGKAAGEQLELSETGFFRRLGGWLANLTNGSIQHMDYKDAERAGYQNEIYTTQGRYQQAVKRARTVGMEEGKIAEFELNFMKILTDNDDLESSSTQLRDLVNDFIAQIDALNSAIERANKFEKERQEILKPYEGKTVNDIITTQQKADIQKLVTDFGKFEKETDSVRLAREVFNANGDARYMADALDRLRYQGYSEAFGDVEYSDASKRVADFQSAYNKLVQGSIVESIINGSIGLNDIRDRISQATDIRHAFTWFKDGKIYDTGEQGGHILDVNMLNDIVKLFENNPNNIEDAKKELLINVVRPYAASVFTQLLTDINTAAADIGEEVIDIEDLGLDVETNEGLRYEKAKRSTAKAETLKKGYTKWLEDAMAERAKARQKIIDDILQANFGMPIEEVEKEADAQMKLFDKTFIPQADTERTKVLRAEQTAQSQQEQAFKTSLKNLQTSFNNMVERIFNSGDIANAMNEYRGAYLDYVDSVRELFDKYEKTEDEIAQEMKELSDDYIKGLTNLVDAFEDDRDLELQLREARGKVSYDTAFQERLKLYEDLITEYDSLLNSGTLNENEARDIRNAKIRTQIKKTEMDTEDLNRSLGSRLSDRLDRIQLQNVRKRITDSESSRRKIRVYQDAVELLNGELRSIEDKNSEYYLELLRKRREFLIKITEEQQSLQNYTHALREQLMGTLSDVISGNLKNGRLTNYGIQHAMNLLSRLSPRFQFDVGGASLQDVMRNARARYSGYTPDVSRAMQQQRRLSEIMDAYITAKQYEDAGIGKNVQTIVTIMGKRQPLYLN